MQSPTIEICNLTKKYGDFTAVDNLTLSIGKGEVFGLLGPNGAGKSTTILMLMGLTEPTSGTVQVCGLNPVSQPIEVKRRVGYLPEDVGFYDDLTGPENLIYTARLNAIPDKDAEERAFRLLERVGLDGEINKKVGKYSRGMRQRLGLADVLIKNPEVIILDEPTLGIDPSGIRDFLGLIVSLSREEGITVLFSSHHLHQVQQVCDRVGIFVKGRLLAQATSLHLPVNSLRRVKSRTAVNMVWKIFITVILKEEKGMKITAIQHRFLTRGYWEEQLRRIVPELRNLCSAYRKSGATPSVPVNGAEGSK